MFNKKQFCVSDQREREREREPPHTREISIGKNKEYKNEKIFYMDVLKTIHKKVRERETERERERDRERNREFPEKCFT